MKWEKELNLKQLDETLANARTFGQIQRPSSGWINTIRTAIGMSARALGQRIGLSQSRIALIEKGEVDKTITLDTLEKVAQGLGCRVVYVLVPEQPSLQTMREKQAYQKAAVLNSYAERHMELEEQATEKQFREETTRKLAEEYLRTWPRDFWND